MSCQIYVEVEEKKRNALETYARASQHCDRVKLTSITWRGSQKIVDVDD